MRLMRLDFCYSLAIFLALGITLPLRAYATNPLALRPHHITANVIDLDRATAWYQNVLGFVVRERGQHGPISYVELVIPGFGIALVKDPAIQSSAPEGPRAPQWLHIVFTVPNPNAAYEALKEKSAKLRTRDGPTSGPVRSFLVEDSEGNEIEIVGDPPP